METNSGIERIREAIRRHHRFLITGHIDPDPDALGSVLAMKHMLTRLGKDAVATSPDPVPEAVRFLPGAEDIVPPERLKGPFDAFVIVDCAPDRIGHKLTPWLDRVGLIINIDHHETNPRQEPIHWVDPQAAAVGEMVYKLCRAMDVDIDEPIAVCLYTAILTDTGSFRFSNTTAETFAIASDLVARGAKPAPIAEALYGQRPWSYFQLLMRALPTLSRTDDGRITWMTVTRQMVQQAGARPDEMEGFVQFPRMVSGAEISMLFRELDSGDTRVSFRSRNRVDVSRLAEEFGGGGHARAAGALLKEPLETAIPRVLARAQLHLDTTAP